MYFLRAANKFSKGQRTLQNNILSNYDKAAFMTARKARQNSRRQRIDGSRFAAELGYDGYPSMRKALQEMIRNRLTSVQRIEVAKSMIDDNDIVRSIIGSDIQNLQATLEILEQDSFNKFVDSIIEARNIYIVGMRTSTSLSSFLGLLSQSSAQQCKRYSRHRRQARCSSR